MDIPFRPKDTEDFERLYNQVLQSPEHKFHTKFKRLEAVVHCVNYGVSRRHSYNAGPACAVRRQGPTARSDSFCASITILPRNLASTRSMVIFSLKTVSSSSGTRKATGREGECYISFLCQFRHAPPLPYPSSVQEESNADQPPLAIRALRKEIWEEVPNCDHDAVKMFSHGNHEDETELMVLGTATWGYYEGHKHVGDLAAHIKLEMDKDDQLRCSFYQIIMVGECVSYVFQDGFVDDMVQGSYCSYEETSEVIVGEFGREGYERGQRSRWKEMISTDREYMLSNQCCCTCTIHIFPRPTGFCHCRKCRLHSQTNLHRKRRRNQSNTEESADEPCKR